MNAWKLGALGVTCVGAFAAAAAAQSFSTTNASAGQSSTPAATTVYSSSDPVIVPSVQARLAYAPFSANYNLQQPQPQTAALAKQYLKAEKANEKEEAKKTLMDMLAKSFDEHLQQQQKEVEELEKQLATLRSTLKKRQEAKTTIVDRRFEQLIQEADGLGWNAPNSTQGPFGGGMRGSMGGVISGGFGGMGGRAVAQPAAAAAPIAPRAP